MFTIEFKNSLTHASRLKSTAKCVKGAISIYIVLNFMGTMLNRFCCILQRMHLKGRYFIWDNQRNVKLIGVIISYALQLQIYGYCIDCTRYLSRNVGPSLDKM
jgi:hypothetical protein